MATVEMLLEQLQDKVFSLVERRFGCQVEVLEIEQQAVFDATTRNVALKEGSAEANQALVVPIVSDRGLSGWLKVTGSIPTPGLERRQLLDLLDLASLQLQRLRKRLAQSQTSDALVAMASAIARPNRGSSFTATSTPIGPKTTFSSSCLIEGTNSTELFKMALEIHQRSGRAIFLNFFDLSPRSEKDLLGLLSATLFVPALEDLKDAETELLIAFLKKGTPATSVRIVAGTYVSQTELGKASAAMQKLCLELSTCRLQMRKGFREYRDSGFFDHLHDTSSSQLWTRTLC